MKEAWSSRSWMIKGSLILLLGGGGFVAWSMGTEIAGAVHATGHIEVEARRQSVQHPDGGVIAALYVKEGEAVAEGAQLLRLDSTELEAQKAQLRRQLYEAWASLDRYGAETRGEGRISWRPELRAAADADPEIATLLRDEAGLFSIRRTNLERTFAQLRERRTQGEAIVSGRRAQLDEGRRQVGLVQDELSGQEKLFARGLTQFSTVANLRRENSRVTAENAELESSIAETLSAIAGFEVERLRAEAQWHEDAHREMRLLQPRAAQLREQLQVVETQLGRLVLRAPMTGKVLGLRAHTVGGVIGSGMEVASIVPAEVALVVLVEIDPAKMDQVQVGQGASLRFPNFNARTTPEIPGSVATVSADAMTDPNTGRRYFTAELAISPEGRKAMGVQTLAPGMPVEAFIRTDYRTPASFLLKPVTDYLSHAMLEE